MKNTKKITYLFLTLLTSSCLNEYEKKITGEYIVSSYKLGKIITENELPKLVLKNDKTFFMKNENHVIKGDWKADDYGDFTDLELFVNHKNYAQADLSGKYLETIRFLNFNEKLFDHPFTEISFIRIR
jgi:hypothetical protein